MELHVQPTCTERVSVIGQPPPSMRRASQFLAPGRDRRPAGAHEDHIMMVSQLKRRPAPVSSLGNALYANGVSWLSAGPIYMRFVPAGTWGCKLPWALGGAAPRPLFKAPLAENHPNPVLQGGAKTARVWGRYPTTLAEPAAPKPPT